MKQLTYDQQKQTTQLFADLQLGIITNLQYNSRMYQIISGKTAAPEETVPVSERSKTISSLAFRLTKSTAEKDSKKISELQHKQQTDAILDEAKLNNISSNEVLNHAMKNHDRYMEVLVKIALAE
jgi:hypothetical protein